MDLSEIREIAVIGAGTMGPGIAQVFAGTDYKVRLCDEKEQTLSQAKTTIKRNLETLVNHDLVQAADIDNIIGRIGFTTSLKDAVRGADLVLECIFENAEAKKRLFQQLDKSCSEKTLITSNTSYLNIFDLLPGRRLKNALITHWFAPPHILPLVEVVCGPKSSGQTVETVVGILKKAGKTPIVMEKFVPGFAINRILRILGREIFFLLDNGYISADQLDLAVKASIAPRMMLLGLVQRYDFTGLDLSAGNLKNKDFLEPPLDNEPASLFGLVDQGKLGVKTGKGFYDYSNQKLEEILAERDDKLLKILKSTEFCLRQTIGEVISAKESNKE